LSSLGRLLWRLA
ncbi:sodium/hydrogen exchanger family protein, partial [Vibrio parahaemolyticus V-223/04]